MVEPSRDSERAAFRIVGARFVSAVATKKEKERARASVESLARGSQCQKLRA